MANELFYDILPHVLQISLINTMRRRSSTYISDCETERPSCYTCTTTQASVKLAISFITLPLLAVNSGQRRSLPAWCGACTRGQGQTLSSATADLLSVA